MCVYIVCLEAIDRIQWEQQIIEGKNVLLSGDFVAKKPFNSNLTLLYRSPKFWCRYNREDMPSYILCYELSHDYGLHEFQS